MQNFIHTEVYIAVDNLFEYFESLIFGDSSPCLDVVLKSVVRAIVGNNITAVRVIYHIVRLQYIRMVRQLERLNLILKKIFSDLVCNIFKFNHLHCHLSLVPHINS